MPRTANRLIDEQALGKRTAIVRAERTDCEELVAAPRQDHRLAVGMAEQRLTSLSVESETPAAKSGHVEHDVSKQALRELGFTGSRPVASLVGQML